MDGRRGDISINTIVIAALALVVLIILIILFRNVILQTGATVQACEARQYQCHADSCPADTQYYGLGNAACKKAHPGTANLVCCIPEPAEPAP